MDAAYVEHYAELYRHHWWWRAREAFLLEQLTKIGPAGGFGPILDVGCGAGLFFDALSRYGEPHGVESDRAAIAMAGRWQKAITPGILEDLPGGHRFGLITMLDVIEHIEDDRQVLRQAAELLRPGGWLMITVPALPVAWTQHDVMNHHYRRYRLPELRQRVLEIPGLALVDLRYFFVWSLPAKLLVRLKEKTLGATAAPVPGIPPKPLNRLLEAFSRWEQKILRRPPFGTSLFALAQRAGP